jgi:hypothetical protein
MGSQTSSQEKQEVYQEILNDINQQHVFKDQSVYVVFGMLMSQDPLIHAGIKFPIPTIKLRNLYSGRLLTLFDQQTNRKSVYPLYYTLMIDLIGSTLVRFRCVADWPLKYPYTYTRTKLVNDQNYQIKSIIYVDLAIERENIQQDFSVQLMYIQNSCQLFESPPAPESSVVKEDADKNYSLNLTQLKIIELASTKEAMDQRIVAIVEKNATKNMGHQAMCIMLQLLLNFRLIKLNAPVRVHAMGNKKVFYAYYQRIFNDMHREGIFLNAMTASNVKTPEELQEYYTRLRTYFLETGHDLTMAQVDILYRKLLNDEKKSIAEIFEQLRGVYIDYLKTLRLALYFRALGFDKVADNHDALDILMQVSAREFITRCQVKHLGV